MCMSPHIMCQGGRVNICVSETTALTSDYYTKLLSLYGQTTKEYLDWLILVLYVLTLIIDGVVDL